LKVLGACTSYGILGFWDFDREKLEAQDESTLGEVVGSEKRSPVFSFLFQFCFNS